MDSVPMPAFDRNVPRLVGAHREIDGPPSPRSGFVAAFASTGAQQIVGGTEQSFRAARGEDGIAVDLLDTDDRLGPGGTIVFLYAALREFIPKKVLRGESAFSRERFAQVDVSAVDKLFDFVCRENGRTHGK